MSKNSLKSKYLRQTVKESPEDENKTLNNLNREWVDIDPKRKQLGRSEELNQMIEERIKKIMYKPEDSESNESSICQSRPQYMKWTYDPYSKITSGGGRNMKILKKDELPKSFSPTHTVNSEGSELSFEKVVGLCRSKLQEMQTRREGLLQSAKTILDPKSSLYQIISSCDPHASALHPQQSGSNSSNHHLAKRKSSSGKKRIRNHLQKKPSQCVESSKVRINQILKRHAQAESAHSAKSDKEEETLKIQKPEPGEEDEGKFQKIIEIQNRTETELVKAEDGAEEKEAEEQKEERVSYKDRVKEEPTKDSKTDAEAAAGNLQVKRICNAILADGRPPKTVPVRTPSEVILISSMIGSITKHTVREPMNMKEIGKINDQTIKTKCSRPVEVKDLVTQAIKDHKIFCIFDNHWYIVRPVREELLSRGWLEVIPERRLIPRKKPPPAGPTFDRVSTTDYGIEAILTAKEAFEDDITEKIKYPPMKTVEKSKMQRKYSDESLKETLSDFRIVPPSAEKKKNNSDIREFVNRYEKDVQLGGKAKDKKRKVSQNGLHTQEGTKSTISSKNTQDVVIGDKNVTPDLAGREDNAKPEACKEAKVKSVADDVKGAKFILTETESKMASKIIQSANARINFMWLSIKPAIHLKCFNYSPEIVNKFQKTTFCTKIGLWSHLNNIQWYAHEVAFPAKSPRMYNTGEADDLQAFFQDFQMTACIGLLKWLSETLFHKGIKGVQKKKGKVPIKAFEFAIRQCERYIRFRDNEDLNVLEEPKGMQEEWNTFLQWFYIITNDHGKVQETSNAQIMVVYTKAVEILRVMKRYWPEIDVDGRLNIWIMKPYCASCGRGIFMTNNVYYIGQHSKYIVQKYIERPLLIYNTKFDIRQWFMITKLIPLEIWMYKECYLRFCTQPFDLRNLHESVHLSNNSVQRKYVSQRDPSLPDQNMWDSNTFQQYLKTVGQPNAWNEIIYPGMRDAIISIMLSAQDTFDSQRRSWFEVYGADFMISANLKDGPWLIEINENPAMDPSTKVTARLCPQMIRDVIKVVVDKRANKNALTGQWELVYRQNYSPSFGSIDIDVKGKRVARISQSMKAGYSSSFTPPSLYLAKKEIESDENSMKQYDVVKSYNSKWNKELHLDVDIRKQAFWKTRARARLVKETSNSRKSQRQATAKSRN